MQLEILKNFVQISNHNFFRVNKSKAKFLVPMAISLAFGVLFATLITLILVPTSYMIIEDIKIFFNTKILEFKRDTTN